MRKIHLFHCSNNSQSVRCVYAQSQKGIDGHKREKGIKHQIAVDSLGNPLGIATTTANVSDKNGGEILLKHIELQYNTIAGAKPDSGYRSAGTRLELQCVKSNFGTSDFNPKEVRFGSAILWR